MSDNGWIGVLYCLIFLFGGWWIGHAATVSWQVVSDGPATWAVTKDYGSTPHWSATPGQVNIEQNELRICNQVPSQEWAERIARLLNEQ